MHLIYVRKCPINWCNRHATQPRRAGSCRLRSTRSRGNAQLVTILKYTGRKSRYVKREKERDDDDGDEFLRISRREGRKRYKNNGGGLDARSDDGARNSRAQCERYATIKPECRGAPPRLRETPKFSSIFLSQGGRVGAEDAFAILAVPL